MRRRLGDRGCRGGNFFGTGVRFSALASTLALWACDGSALRVVPEDPAALVVVGGDGQSARSGAPVPEPLVVQVLDDVGNPVPDVEVRFSIVEGSGARVSSEVAVTDLRGTAAAGWWIGVGGGPQAVEAQVPGLTPVRFTATAVPSGVVRGVVFHDRDRDGRAANSEGLSGARVTLSGPGGLSETLTTNSLGVFSRGDLGVGTYTVVLRPESVPVSLALLGDGSADVQLAFDDTASVELGTLSVLSGGASVSGTVTVPQGISRDQVRVGSIGNGFRPVEGDGGFTLPVSDTVSHLVMALDPQRSRVLYLGATTGAHLEERGTLRLDARSTAHALLLHSPLLPTRQPELLAEVEQLVSGLAAVDNLVALINAAAQEGRSFTDDPNFEGVLTTAMASLLSELVRIGEATEAGQAVVAIPSDEGISDASGVRVEQTTSPFAAQQSLTLRNAKPRNVDVYAYPLGADGRLILDGASVRKLPKARVVPTNLLSLARFTAKLVRGGVAEAWSDTSPQSLGFSFVPGQRDEYQITAYGLGAARLSSDLPFLATGEALPMLAPVVTTAVLDVLLPPLLSLASVSPETLGLSAGEAVELARVMGPLLNGTQFFNSMSRNDHGSAFVSLITALSQCGAPCSEIVFAPLPGVSAAVSVFMAKVATCTAATVASGGTLGVVCGALYAYKIAKALATAANSAWIVYSSASAEMREEFPLLRHLVVPGAGDQIRTFIGEGRATVDWPLSVTAATTVRLRAESSGGVEFNLDVFDDRGTRVYGTGLGRGGAGIDVASLALARAGEHRVRIQRHLNTSGTVTIRLDPVQTAVGRLAGVVIRWGGSTGVSDASVRFLRDGQEVVSVRSDALGRYSSPDLPVGTYDIIVSAPGFREVRLFGQAVLAGQVVTVEPVPLVDASPSPGAISGYVRDARTFNVIGGATVTLRAGMNAIGGPEVARTTTTSTGSYRFSNVQSGVYTVSALRSGYADGHRTGISVGSQEVANQDVILSSSDGGGEDVWRIVLTWGATPADLDSHLTGPSGSTRFHVYFSSRGSLSGPPYAALDRDDTSAYGPETVTIGRTTSGTYRYSVHDYSNRSSSSSAALSRSGARVEVYRGSVRTDVFFPPDQPGTLWTVFEMAGGTVTPVNRMSFTSSAGGIPVSGGSGQSGVSDEATIRREVARQSKSLAGGGR